MDEDALTLAAEAVDIVQIGSRNMQNASLVRAARGLRRLMAQATGRPLLASHPAAA